MSNDLTPPPHWATGAIFIKSTKLAKLSYLRVLTGLALSLAG